ncbi:CocE/NonD family hydrolase C-terminal non-catalytic domain-containing protein [Crossiella sp. NPDC003009]
MAPVGRGSARRDCVHSGRQRHEFSLRPGESHAVGRRPGAIRLVRITLDPTAHRFEPGHRIRSQVSGGVFPRFARNLGTGKNSGTGTATKPVTHTIHHDVSRPSRLSLPIADGLA